MRVLAINNYDLEWPQKDFPNVPRHQYWGIDMMREQGCIVDTRVMQTPSWMRKILGKYGAVLHNFLFAIKVVLCYGRKYDAFVAFFSPSLTFFPFFRKIKLIKGKLVAFVHHGGLPKAAISSLDKVVFLSRPVYDDYLMLGLKNAELLDWNPDIDFYATTYEQMKKNEKLRLAKPILISTGKSFRDDELLISVCKTIGQPLRLFADRENNLDPIVKYAAKEGYPRMLSVMKTCAINVVACKDHARNGRKNLCGLTSVIDGLALGMPLIISDNCNLSFDVEKEGFGFVYKCGSFQSLKEKIELMTSNQELMSEMGNRARVFAEKNNYKIYCERLWKIMDL